MNIKIPKSVVDDFKKNHNNANYKDAIKNLLIFEEIIDINTIVNFKEISNKFQGIYIEERKMLIYFTQKLNETDKLKARNTFVSQNFEPLFEFRKGLNKECKILISLHFLDFSKDLNFFLPNSIVLNLKILLTHKNIEIGKSIDKILENKILCFDNLDEYVNNVTDSSKKNEGNIPTYIDKNIKNKVLTIFGKLDGANFAQTIQHCRNLQILKGEYNLEFYLLTNKNSKKILQSRINSILEIVDEIIESQVFETNIKIFDRNQRIFRINIIEKYKELLDIEKCFCCDYPIKENLIAAHIHRHADIEKELNSKIQNMNDNSLEKINIIKEACEMTTSGSNGFLLCRNHDIEFEKGMIFFDLEKNKFVLNELLNRKHDSNVPEYITKIIEKYEKFHKFKTNDDLFVENIRKHHLRIGINK